MKFLKKTAALLFCVALALSVMAVSAMAGSAMPPDNPVFTLRLQQTSEFKNADSSADSSLEVHASPASTVNYDIYLKSTVAAQNVSSLSFKIATTAGIGNVAVKLYQAYDANKPAADALTTSYSGGIIYSYTAGGVAGNANDLVLTNANEYYKVGTVSFTVNSVKDHQVVTPQLSDINLYVRVDGNYNANAYTVTYDTPNSDTLALHVNPVYTITLNRYKKNLTTTGTATTGDGVKTAYADTDYSDSYAENEGAPTSKVKTLYYDFDGNFYSTYNDATYATAAGKLDVPEDLDGYTYDGWFVKSADVATDWAAQTATTLSGITVLVPKDAGALGTFNSNIGIGGGKTGNVTFEAKYTPIVYNYKLVYGNGTTSDVTGTYTIESVKDTANNAGAATLDPAAVAFNIPATGAVGADGVPAWTGYKFMGWSATQEANSSHVGYNTAVWKAYSDTDYDADSSENANLITTADAHIGKNAFGDVVLTAVWDEDGIFASAEYGYANSGDKLMLFAAPKSNYDKKDTYTFGNGTYKAMFIVDGRYNSVFGDQLTDESGYEIYAFIADANAAKKVNVQITKAASGATADGNTTILYDGNVYRDSSINTADYGNVDALLAANGGTVQAFTLTADTMRARLEADIAKAGDTQSYGASATDTIESETKYASIWDIKKIISLLT